MRDVLQHLGVLPADSRQNHSIHNLALGPSRSHWGLSKKGGVEDKGVEVLADLGRVVVDRAAIIAVIRFVVGPMVQEELLCLGAAPSSPSLVRELQGKVQSGERTTARVPRVDGGLAVLRDRLRSSGRLPSQTRWHDHFCAILKHLSIASGERVPHAGVRRDGVVPSVVGGLTVCEAIHGAVGKASGLAASRAARFLRAIIIAPRHEHGNDWLAETSLLVAA
mmetsp:Transcript_78397/g.196876  ORF Transcript_78397/g.196876 Transcript_78397/m.196876 type:complete len:222 (+) Transcript_78397:195-860(+)